MKKLLLFLLLLGVGLFGVAYLLNFKIPGLTADPKVKEPGKAKVENGDITVKISATGKTVPKNVRYVGLDLPFAKVVSISPEAEIGRVVKANDELAVLQLTTLETQQAEYKLELAHASIKSAEAGAALAQAAQNEAEAAKLAADSNLKYADEEVKFAEGLGEAAKARQELARKARDTAREKIKMAEAGLKKADYGIKTAEQKMLEAKANLKLAEAALKPIAVKAPITGTIIEKKIMVGQPVSAQATPVLFAMVPDLNETQIVVPVAESDVVKVLSRMGEMEQKGEKMTARIHFDAYPFDARTNSEVNFEGDVVSVSHVPAALPSRAGLPAELAAAAGPAQTMYSVTIENIRTVNKEDATPRPLRAGFTANVELIIKEVKNVLRVPTRALNYSPDKPTADEADALKKRQSTNWSPLWLWENGKHRLIFVRRGESDGQWTEVVDVDPSPKKEIVLKPGETEVITEPPPPEKGLSVKTF